jgi:hypothetical protein
MASGNDMKAAEATYAGFLTLLKYGVVTVAIVAAVVVWLIA